MKPLTILCVKVGTKYPSHMVNNLFRMCRRHITKPFEMFCYTDNPKGIDKNIHIIDYVEHDFDIVVYNKLFMFSELFNKQLPEGDRVFFDLDVVIKQNIDDVVSCKNGDVTVIEAEWRPKWDYGFPVFHHPFNSSCITWEDNGAQKVWDHVMKDPERYMNKYRWGMDSFMFYEKQHMNVTFGYFPTRKFYSFLYGVDYMENFLHHHLGAYRESKFRDIVKGIPVVLFNGPVSLDKYEHMFKKYYAD